MYWYLNKFNFFFCYYNLLDYLSYGLKLLNYLFINSLFRIWLKLVKWFNRKLS